MKKFKIGLLFGGVGIMAVVSLLLGALFAALFSLGVLPLGAMEGVSWGITLVGCFLGALWVSRRAETMPLPISLGAVIFYLFDIFILRGLIFRTVGENVLILFLTGIFGVVVASFLAVGRNMSAYRGKNRLRKGKKG